MNHIASQQQAQLHLLAVIAEAAQTLATMTTEKAAHHHQIERLQEWLQANQEWLQANSLYQSFDGDAADLMIALVERQRYELIQLKKLLGEIFEQLTLIDADNATLLRKLRTFQEQEDA